MVVVARLGGGGGGESPSGTAFPTPTATSAQSAAPRPVTSWRDVGYDLTYKADLVEKLPAPPELVMLGGSRAQRFEPSHIERVTGLSALNFAVQNCWPEDAYAISRYLIERAPGVKLQCFFAVQATTFGEIPMHPGLLYGPRLVRWFPDALVAEQKEANEPLEVRRVPSSNRFSSRGRLLYNFYDKRLDAGGTQERAMRIYLDRMVPKAGSTTQVSQRRSRAYFRKLLALFNDRGVTPAIVIMPYHPDALSAFLEVGWQRKQDPLKGYLRSLQDEYDFRVLDYTEIGSFGGRPEWFYDGAHITKENARLAFEQAVRDAPECFR